MSAARICTPARKGQSSLPLAMALTKMHACMWLNVTMQQGRRHHEKSEGAKMGPSLSMSKKKRLNCIIIIFSRWLAVAKLGGSSPCVSPLCKCTGN
jgi:hypothetical protein